MIESKRRVVTVDGVEYVVIKLHASAGPKDKLLCIGPDGENIIIEVKHLEYKDAPTKKVTIRVHP